MKGIDCLKETLFSLQMHDFKWLLLNSGLKLSKLSYFRQ
jgi:hypothetical protein